MSANQKTIESGPSVVESPSAHYEGQDLEALADIPRYQNWLLESFRARLAGRVLEVGAGSGNLANLYVDDVSEAVLVEPAPNLAARLKERFSKRKNVRVVGAHLEDAASVAPTVNLSPHSFDACLLVNVLEHIEDDVAVLRHARELVRPGGSLLLFVPALPQLYGSLDALVHHHRRYTKDSLRRTVESAGFHITALRYFDVLGVLPWLLAGRVLRRQRFDETAAQLYDRWFVPLGSRLERHWTPPLGKNLMCIAAAAPTGSLG